MIKSKYFGITASICLSLTSCNIVKNHGASSEFPTFSWEAHRGGRGLYPEESIAAMKHAIDLPQVTTLEMDCHITKDNKVVVFHDDYLNPKFVLKPDGSEIASNDKSFKIYAINYNDLIKYDIGSKFYSDFPQQKKQVAHIAKLADLIDSTEAYAKLKRKKPMYYNIEIKSKDGMDGIYHPKVDQFTDLTLQVIIDKRIAARTVVQSFDKRAIIYLHKTYPQIKASYLIDNKNKQTIEEIIADLGFKPFIISPYYKMVTPDFVADCHKLGIKVLPWTVNTKDEIDQLVSLKVDGIISDYPNLF